MDGEVRDPGALFGKSRPKAGRPHRWGVSLLALLGAGPAAADSLSVAPLAVACDEIDEGQLVRVLLTAGGCIEAPFAGCDDGGLLLLADGVERAMPFAEVAGIWKRDRDTARGAGVGGAVGAIGGGISGLLLGLLLDALGESGEEINVAETALAGAGIGAAGGAVTGAIVGAAIPRWRLVHARHGVPTRAPSGDPSAGTRAGAPEAGAVSEGTADLRSQAGRIGSIALALGPGWGEGSRDAGFAGTLTLAADFASGVSIGLESGTVDAGPQKRPEGPVPLDVGYATDSQVKFGGALVRYTIRVGSIQPYVVGGLAGYSWEDGFVGASLGAGLGLPLSRRPVAARLEYRRHDNIQNLVGVDPGFSTLTVGIGYFW